MISVGVLALLGVITQSAMALTVPYSAAYVIKEPFYDDLVVEWNVGSSTIPFSMAPKTADTATVLSRALVTREMRGTQNIVRLTAGGWARMFTSYQCTACLPLYAQKLGNNIVFQVSNDG